MPVTRAAVAAVYLCAVMFFWRFQMTVYTATVPVYLALVPLALLLDIPRDAVVRTLVFGAVTMGALLVVLLQGAELARPSVTLVGLLIVMVCWVGIGAAIRELRLDGWKALALAVKVVIRLQLALQLAAILGLDPLGNRTFPHYYLPIDRMPGLLIEPSHVAITFSPLIAAAFWPKDRCFGGELTRWDFALVFAIVFLCPSATLVAVLGLALALRIAARAPVLGFAMIAVPVLIVQNLGIVLGLLPDAIADRIGTLVFIVRTGYFDGSSNLTSVVFYGGFRAAMTTLADYPLGLGFLNMGAAYATDGLAHYMSVAGDTNVHDGSSMLFKLVTEFGWLGVAFVVYSVLVIWRYFTTHEGDLTAGVLAFALLAFFARGASYLDGPVLVSLAVILFGLRPPREAPSLGAPARA